MFDIISYILGLVKGRGNIDIAASSIVCVDDGEGNITVTLEG